MKKMLWGTFAAAIVISACTAMSSKEQLRQKMSACVDKVITLPEECVFTKLVDDTVNIESFNNLKIVRHINSYGCIGCRMNLGGWEAFGRMIDSITNGKVEQLIVIQASKQKDAEVPILSAKYSRPVCIDIENKFGIANSKILETGFDVFLLDGDNRIMLIGDPTSSKAIKELYIKTICDYLGIDNIETETINAGNNRKYLGQFDWRNERTTFFTIYNNSDSVIHIDTLYTSCDCTNAFINKYDIEIGDSARIDVFFKAEKPEQFMREIYVDIRGKEQAVFTIEGESI